MARLSTYTSDTVDKSDKLIGTSSGGETKNFVISDISTFLANTNAAGVAGQITYQYKASSGDKASGTFLGTFSSGSTFANLTSIKVSKYPADSSLSVVNLLTSYNNNQIILSSINHPDNFGVYSISNVAQDGSSDYYDITVGFVSGNGSLSNDNYYGINSTSIVASAYATLTGTQVLTNKTLTSPVLNTGVSGTAIKDEDDMSSNSATHLATQQSIKAYVDNQLTASDLDFQGDSGGALSIDLDSETLDIAGDGAGISTAGSGNQITISGDHDALTNFVANEHIDHTSVTLTAGTGLSGGGTIASNRTFAVEAAQTGITSVLNTSLVIGRDSDNDIDFATDNQIIFRVSGGDNVIFKASGEIEATSLDISGDVDVDGTLEADAITVDGTALDTHIAGVTVTNATNSAHTLVTDNENTNEDNPITFVEGATTSTGNIGLEMDGDFHYNPSTGRLTASQLAGTLQTASQTNITGVGTISTGVWNGTAVASAYLDSDTMHLSVAQTITGEKTIDGSDKFYFRDSAIYLHSDADGYLEMVADTGVSLKIGSTEQVILTDGAFTPTSDSDVDLGSSSKYWKDSYIDSITTTGNVVVGGNLTVSGTTTTVDSTTVAIADSMLKLAKDQANTADAVDFGFYGQYGDSGTHKYAGIFRDLSASGDPWTFFDGLQAEPGTTVNTSGTGYDLADISAGGITSADGFTGTLLTAAQGNVTSLGTLTTLTVDNVIINGTTIGHTSDTDLITLADGVFTVAGEIDGTTLDISGNADIDGTTNLDDVDIDGNVQIDGTLTVGVDDTGYDVKLFGATSGDYILWDESDNELETAGGATINIIKDKLKIGGTAVTTTAAELNFLDTAAANTVVNSKAVIYGSSGELAGTLSTAAQGNVTSLGTLTTLTVDNVIINGTTIGHTDDTDLLTLASGALTVAGTVRMGTSTETANTNFDDLVIENVAGHSGITIFSKSDSDGAIYFGDVEANNLGQIKYLHGSNAMTFATNDGSASLTLDSGTDATFAGSIGVTGATPANGYSVEITPSGGNIIRSTRGSSVLAAYQSLNSHVYLGTTSNNQLILIQNDGAALTIDTSKNATFAGSVTTTSATATDFMNVKADDAEIYWTIAANNDYWRWRRDASDNFILDHYNGSGTGTALSFDGSQNATFSGDVTMNGNVQITNSSGDTLTLTKGTTEPSFRIEGDTDKDFVITVSGELLTFTQNDGTTDILTLDHDTKAATFAGNVDVGAGGISACRFTSRGATDDTSAYALEAANSSGATLFAVRNDGGVLVGGTLKTYHSNVTSVMEFADQASIFTRANETYIGQNVYYDSGDDGTAIEAGKGTLIRLRRGEINMYFSAASASSADDTHSMQEKFTLTDAGDLTLYGDVNVNLADGADEFTIISANNQFDNTDDADAVFALKYYGQGAFHTHRVGSSWNSIVENPNGSGTMEWWINGGQKLQLGNSGNFGVGASSHATYRMLVYADTDGDWLVNFLNGHNGDGNGLLLDATDGSSGEIQRWRTYNGSLMARCMADGDFENANNSYGSTSDKKLKENIVDATPKLDDLCKVKIRNFNKIGEDTKQIGVIAQELEEIFPKMISESEDLEITKDGTKKLGTKTKSVKYSVFVPMLVKAIQEQQEIIEDLKKRIETLEK